MGVEFFSECKCSGGSKISKESFFLDWFITARVRSTTGGYFFTRVCLLTGEYLPWVVGAGYLPWMGGTYLGWGVPTLDGVPTLACGGTYLGHGCTYSGWGMPTLDGGHLPWTSYPAGSTPLVASHRRTFLFWYVFTLNLI